MTSQELERQMEKIYCELDRDFSDVVGGERVNAVSRGYYEWLRRDAVINDFIPLLVYRLTREELVRVDRDELPDSA